MSLEWFAEQMQATAEKEAQIRARMKETPCLDCQTIEKLQTQREAFIVYARSLELNGLDEEAAHRLPRDSHRAVSKSVSVGSGPPAQVISGAFGGSFASKTASPRLVSASKVER